MILQEDLRISYHLARLYKAQKLAQSQFPPKEPFQGFEDPAESHNGIPEGLRVEIAELPVEFRKGELCGENGMKVIEELPAARGDLILKLLKELGSRKRGEDGENRISYPPPLYEGEEILKILFRVLGIDDEIGHIPHFVPLQDLYRPLIISHTSFLFELLKPHIRYLLESHENPRKTRFLPEGHEIGIPRDAIASRLYPELLSNSGFPYEMSYLPSAGDVREEVIIANEDLIFRNSQDLLHHPLGAFVSDRSPEELVHRAEIAAKGAAAARLEQGDALLESQEVVFPVRPGELDRREGEEVEIFDPLSGAGEDLTSVLMPIQNEARNPLNLLPPLQSSNELPYRDLPLSHHDDVDGGMKEIIGLQRWVMPSHDDENVLLLLFDRGGELQSDAHIFGVRAGEGADVRVERPHLLPQLRGAFGLHELKIVILKRCSYHLQAQRLEMTEGLQGEALPHTRLHEQYPHPSLLSPSSASPLLSS